MLTYRRNAKDFLKKAFSEWTVLKSTVVDQQYDIPRDSGICELKTSVVTFVAKKWIEIKWLRHYCRKKVSIKKWQRRIIHMENKLINTGQNSIMDNFIETDDILKDMRHIIESSQKAAYQAVNMTLVQRNWMMGYRIASEELHGENAGRVWSKDNKEII